MSAPDIKKKIESIRVECDAKNGDFLTINRVEHGDKLKYVQFVQQCVHTNDLLLTRANAEALVKALNEMLKAG